MRNERVVRGRCKTHGRVMRCPLCNEDGTKPLPKPPKPPRREQIPPASPARILEAVQAVDKRLDDLIEFCTKLHERQLNTEKWIHDVEVSARADGDAGQ